MTADFLIEMAWKSSVVCGGVLLLLGIARDQSPAQRARLAFAGMALLPILPLLTFALPAIEFTAPAPIGTTLPSNPLEPAMLPSVSIAAVAPVAEPAFQLSLDATLTLLWLAGAGALFLRLCWGVVTLQRWTRQGRAVRSSQWHSALNWNGGSSVRLLVNSNVDSPLSWGWIKPVILIGEAEAASTTNAAAIIAHEMAHVKRRDWLRLLLARSVAALFWFNPLVWLLERACLREMEEAADMDAVRTVRPDHYAETLLSVARDRQLLMANSIAAGELSKRILQVLNCDARRPAARWKVTGALALLGLAAPVAAFQFVPEAFNEVPSPALSKTVAPLTGTTAVKPTVGSSRAQTWASSKSSPTVAVETSGIRANPVPSKAVAPATAALTAVMAAVAAVAQPADVADDALDADLERAQQALNAQTERTAELAERVSELAEKKAAKARKMAAKSMAEGAVSMEKGADNMLRGAESMRKEAARMHDPAYRKRKIAEEAARGHVVTDQELIDAIPELQRGADEMVKGAADMRQGAADMRRSASEQD